MFVGHVNDAPGDEGPRAIEMHAAEEFRVLASAGLQHQREGRVNAEEGFAEIDLHVSLHCIQRVHDGGNEGA